MKILINMFLLFLAIGIPVQFYFLWDVTPKNFLAYGIFIFIMWIILGNSKRLLGKLIMKIKKYAIFEPNLIFNEVKYEVGKRYKKKEFLFIDTNIRKLFLDYFEIYDITKQIQIRIVYEYDDCYIIHNEINYYNDFEYNVENTIKNFFLLLRYRNEYVMNKNIDSMSIYEKIALATVGNRIHIKKLVTWIKENQNKMEDDHYFQNLQYNVLKNIDKNEFYLNDSEIAYSFFKNLRFKELDRILKDNNVIYNEAIADLGYDKYLDYFIDNKEYLKSEILTHNILSKGRHKDLDYFINNHKEYWVANLIINQQREKDLIKLSKSENDDISWLANKELNEIEFP